jgi:ABC-type transporter Mla maintaining outer membrane lipid asymmetry permease subunit MlaE
MALLVAVIGVFMAVVSIFTVVPRVPLVEAVILAATSFGAGAALTAAIGLRRRQ